MFSGQASAGKRGSMNYYDNQDDFEKRGIDYDLVHCLQYNPQPFHIGEVDVVLAVFEGENDGADWRWILKLKKDAAKKHENKFVYLQGGCDYTGWDCQSGANSQFCKSAKEAAELSKSKEFASCCDETFLVGVFLKLSEQLKSKKYKTWREGKESEFKNDLPKI